VSGRKILRVLQGERVEPAPVWLMRQAGRYLPEYRELRQRAPDFLQFCYSPALAAEASLQPLRRFDLDAAIVFSDILTIPDALGRRVRFPERGGPQLDALVEDASWRLGEPSRAIQRLSPVYETVQRVRSQMEQQQTLIGFAGGPWTVATYMLQGQGGPKDRARRAFYERAEDVDALLAVLAETTALHLAEQAKAGADCVQLFESWAEGLPSSLFERLVIRPTRQIVMRLSELGVRSPVIGFPRAATSEQIVAYASETRVDALGVDTAARAAALRTHMDRVMPMQGNLDPQLLVVGGAALERGVAQVLDDFAGGPHIFNLGHGITPDAKPEHVAHLLRLIGKI
jgi:uroporphyrinogen decarboxylase